MGQPEVLLGILPGAGATWRLARIVGLGTAKELIFTGRRIGADEAKQLGLVNRVVTDAEVLSAAKALGKEIARGSRLAVRMAKRAIHAGMWADPATAMTLESTMQAVLFEDHEKFSRMEAFLSKRRGKSSPKGE
jgi:enoyl-CoA hydratase/carnithine racemase